MDRDSKMSGAAMRRANGRMIYTPLAGTMVSNFRTMSDQAMFAPDETFQASRIFDFRRKGVDPPTRREQMTTRRLQFGCAVGKT